MARAPFFVSAGVIVAASATAVHLVASHDPFATDSAALLAGGLLLFALITTAGVLLSRGRWAQRLGIAVSAAMLGLSVSGDLNVSAGVAAAASGLALFGMAGPWLRGWLRGRPAAMGPGPQAVLLLLATLALAPGVAVANPSRLRVSHWSIAGFALLVGWGYSRASVASLWIIRLVALPAAVAAALQSPATGAAYLVAHGLGLTFLAWSPDAKRAVTPLLDRVYGERKPRPMHSRTGERT